MEELGMGAVRSIKSSRRWCWQDKDILDLIRENFNGQRLTTALALYISLTELGSNASSDQFPAYYVQLANLVGKSLSTVRNYCNEFVKLGILAKENRKLDEKTNLANQWSLLTPSVNNNYQTSTNNTYTTSVKDDYQQLEENELEKDNKNGVSKFSETEAYKKLKEKAEQLRRTTNA